MSGASSVNVGAGFDLTFNNLFTWQGGNMDGGGTINANGPVDLTVFTHNISDRTLNTAGSVTWSGGAISFASVLPGTPEVINNLATGTWTTNFDGAINGSGGTFVNNGTFTYTVNGITQTKSITRQIYASPLTVCKQ